MYQGFAAVYDQFMGDVPYDAWAAYINRILQQHLPHTQNGEAPMVLDMACGTGSITLRLAAMGYDMIGVDASADMLVQAQEKAYEAGRRVLWLAQDMRELDLYGTVDAAVCVCDGLNYLLEDDELREVFRRVRLFLNPGGVFIFDMNTEYKFREVLGDKSFGGEHGNDAYVWDNHYDAHSQINEYHVVFYSRKGGQPFEELHYQRAYDLETVCAWLAEADFTVEMRDGYSDLPPHETSTRVTYLCKC